MRKPAAFRCETPACGAATMAHAELQDMDHELNLGETLRRAVESDDNGAFIDLLDRIEKEVPAMERLLDFGPGFAEALRLGRQPFVAHFLERTKTDMNAPVHDGCTPLVYAAGGPPVPSTTAVVGTLIERGADVNLLAPGPRTTPLMKACGVGNVEVAGLLISRGASVSMQHPLGCTDWPKPRVLPNSA